MPGLRHVWTGLYTDVYIFLEDANGDPIGMADKTRMANTDTPLMLYCYWRNVNITQELQAERRPATGRSYLKIVSRPGVYVATIGHLEWLMEDEWDINVFNRENRFTVVIRDYDPGNTRDGGIDTGDEQRILYHSLPQNLDSKKREGNEFAQSNVTWWAEQMETSFA